MSRIELELRPMAFRLRAPLRTAAASYEGRRAMVVVLRTDQRIGVGEGTPLEQFGTESWETLCQTLRDAAETWQRRRPPTKLSHVDELLAELGPLDGTPAARHALETALLDLVAQQERVPLAALLVRAPLARRVRVAALLSEQDPAALATQAREATDAGHDTVKIKVGVGSLSEDIDRLSAVRAAVGDRGLIRIDANGAWTRVVAEEALNALAPHRIELCEQPVPADDVEGLGALRSLGLLRIGADETLSNPEAAQRLIETRGVDVLVLKPMVLGGLRRAVSLAQRAAKQGMTAYVSSSLEGPIGRLAALHVAVAMGDADHAHGLGVGALFDPSARPSLLEPQAGTLGLLEEPGLGLSW